MIIPIYKPLGASSHQLAAKVGLLYNKKATHTGTLDPMAEGVLTVLTGEDRFKKQLLADVKKTYEFEILIGFNTDSHDLLGLITNKTTPALINKSEKNKINKTFIKIREKSKQIIPTFSAKRYAGQSGFDLGKDTQSLPDIEQDIYIYSLELLDSYSLTSDVLLNLIISKISTVEGDFRQNSVIQAWRDSLCSKENKTIRFTILKCQAVTSKRTYIRGIVRDLSEQLNLSCTTFSISRIRNGDYSILDTICFI